MRARRDTTTTTSLSDSCCSLYDFLLPKFWRHVRRPGATDDDGDDCDGPFTNATSEPRIVIVMAGDHPPPYLTSDDGPSANTTSKRIAMTPIDGGGAAPARSPDLPHVPSTLLETILLDESSSPHDIPLQELKEITDNFSVDRILGQGGFSVVYKGVLRNGEMIAVKRIASSLVPGLQKQFEREVYHLMVLRHPNIVRCVGYCYET